MSRLVRRNCFPSVVTSQSPRLLHLSFPSANCPSSCASPDPTSPNELSAFLPGTLSRPFLRLTAPSLEPLRPFPTGKSRNQSQSQSRFLSPSGVEGGSPRSIHPRHDGSPLPRGEKPPPSLPCLYYLVPFPACHRLFTPPVGTPVRHRLYPSPYRCPSSKPSLLGILNDLT